MSHSCVKRLTMFGLQLYRDLQLKQIQSQNVQHLQADIRPDSPNITSPGRLSLKAQKLKQAQQRGHQGGALSTQSAGVTSHSPAT